MSSKVRREVAHTVQRASTLRSVRAGAAGALLLLAGGCASRSGVPVRAEPELQVRTAQCRAEVRAEPLPPLSAVLDTAGLTRKVRSLFEEQRIEGAGVLLTLWYEPEGLNVRRDILAHDLPPVLADSVQKLVFSTLRPAPERESPWGARLQVEMRGEAATYALHPREACPPRPRSRDLETEIASYLGSGVRYRRGSRERVVLMEVIVHPLGYVLDARIARGAPPGGSLELSLRDHVRQFSFYPASLDGVPVTGTVMVPVRIRG